MAPRAILIDTANRVLSSYTTLDPATLLAPLSPAGTMQLLPHSLSRPLWTKSEYALQVERLCKIFKSFTATPFLTVVDEEECRVMVHAKTDAWTVGGFHYESEGVWMLRMDEDGGSVMEVREFVDSKKQGEFFEEVGRMMKAKAAKESEAGQTDGELNGTDGEQDDR